MKRYLFVFQNVGENLIATNQMEYYFDSLQDVKSFIREGNGFILPEAIRPVSLFEIEDVSSYLKSMQRHLDISKRIKIPVVKIEDEIEL